MSTPLEVNRAGDAYVWPNATWDLIWAAEGQEPDNWAFPHYFGRACATLAYPFQQKPIITAFLDAYSASTTAVETEAYAVRDSGILASAEGDALRIAAALVRAPWVSTWADDTARKLIYFTADALALDTGWGPWVTLVQSLWGTVEVWRNDDAYVSLALSNPDTGMWADLGSAYMVQLALDQLPAGIAIDLIDVSSSVYGLHFADATSLPAYDAPGYRLGDSTNSATGDSAFDHDPV